jgi:hypothetical protein
MCLLVFDHLACGHFVAKDSNKVQCARQLGHDPDKQQAFEIAGKFQYEPDASDSRLGKISGGADCIGTSIVVSQNDQKLEIIFDHADIICQDCREADDALPHDKKRYKHVPEVLILDDEQIMILPR